MSDKYQRLFFIFKNMDIIAGNPSGYLKIEINSGSVKLQLSISNLAERSGWVYRLYGLKKTENGLTYTDICNIPVLNNRADIKISNQNDKMGSNGLNIDDINVYAVISHSIDREESFICPLVAYVNGETEWKRELEKLLSSSKEILQIDSSENKDESRLDNVIEPQQKIDNEELIMEAREAEELVESGEQAKEELIQPQAEEVITKESVLPVENVNTDEPMLENKSEENVWLDVESKLRTEDQAGTPEGWNDILESAERDFNDILSFDMDGHVPNLKEELDKSFEKCNPFKMKSKNFLWWKINSPGFLNNILFRNNIKSYLLFNPKVMLAHYKYRYIIFGIRSLKHTGREQLVCGIPGVYNIDENPFGNMGSWVQLEGYKPKYGAFGYWIVMIDPRTGKLIKIK